MNKMNRTAKLCFYRARKSEGDIAIISERTGYSISHISNVIAGRRSVPQEIANTMYKLSCRRIKNSAK